MGHTNPFNSELVLFLNGEEEVEGKGASRPAPALASGGQGMRWGHSTEKGSHLDGSLR